MAIQTVTFHWSDEYGQCYDCGVPAAYCTKGRETTDETALYCSVCAMGHVMDGEEFTYLFED